MLQSLQLAATITGELECDLEPAEQFWKQSLCTATMLTNAKVAQSGQYSQAS